MATYYAEAATILEKILDHKGSIKSLAYSDEVQHKKTTFALVLQTLKYRELILEIGTRSKFFELERIKQPSALQIIYLFDFLFGQGIRGGGKFKKLILSHKNALQSELTRMKVRKGIAKNEDLLPENIRNPIQLPRYVRINTLKTKRNEVIEQLQAEYIFKGEQKIPGVPSNKDFYLDPVIPDLLVFAPQISFHNHQLLKTGKIILQDKASCLPPVVLSPPKGSNVIDACAAPGNKTSMLSALLQNSGKVFAFDKDPKRFETLKRMTTQAGASNIVVENKDFLQVSPGDQKYANVTHILLDPSCSGSGILGRLDFLVSDTKVDIDELEDLTITTEQSRLDALSKFQKTLLLHSFKFPKVTKVVYSTCSIHDQENELVVEQVLREQSNFILSNALPVWSHRGKDSQKATLRASPNTTYTNGFFVALFERVNKKRTAEAGNMNPIPLEEEIQDQEQVVKNAYTDIPTEPAKKKRKKKKKTSEASSDLLPSAEGKS